MKNYQYLGFIDNSGGNTLTSGANPGALVLEETMSSIELFQDYMMGFLFLLCIAALISQLTKGG